MRRITVVNRSPHVVVCRIEPTYRGTGSEYYSVLPSDTETLKLPSFRVGLVLAPQLQAEKAAMFDEAAPTAVDDFAIRVPLSLGAKWIAVPVPEECPWLVYRVKVTKRHHQLLILPRRDLSSFLSEIPDSVSLSCVTLPGTHDTMAFYGWPISQCQSLDTPLAVQLASGIRVLDIRLAIVDNRLIAYHGPYPQRAAFQEILSFIHAFLTADKTKRETVIVSIKQEDFRTVPGEVFSKLVRDEITNGPGGLDMWFLDNRIPLIGEARGKVIMFSRFGGDGEGWENGVEGIGIHPTTWPDSKKDGFTWDCKNTVVRTHDWYNIPSFLSIPEKTQLATEILLPPPIDPPLPSLAITFFSASGFPLAFPPTIARGFGWPKVGLGVEGVNARVVRWLASMLGAADASGRVKDPRIRGWTLADFYADPEPALVPLLVECNFHGRVPGEEGWPAL
ncbi:PLC-like phosphodiesterase [Phanerochaete sordida]|uniref:PLC-like phosphodiesterase n=1 Tax=Phanerochaete sordida TaxID=48140 RepID=A0A9P3LA96_9APHY|nr:PLC-like phosphodiesterase [Phanerochaete sordida]